VFEADGTITADNTDGPGLIGAIAVQAPGFDLSASPVVILGAGGAARGAAAALALAGAPKVSIVNRTFARAEAIARSIGGVVEAASDDELDTLLAQAGLVINATSLGLGGGTGPAARLELTPETAVVVDMVYKPLRTEFLRRAEAAGRRTVDGLEMLLRQAVPSFEAFFGVAPPAGVDVRALALAQLGERTRGRSMIVLGLTGSIGMGKSTTAQMFIDEGVPVYDSDAAVHALYASGGAAVAPVEAAFPGVVVDGAIDRARLSAAVMGNSEALAVLESIVHPLVGAHRIGFFEDAQAQGADIVVLDIPLLYETGGEKKVDKVVVVSAPADVQRRRVLARPGMEGQVRGHPGSPDAGRRKARPGRFRDRHRPGPGRRPRPGPRHPDSPSRPGSA
jgi:dephospho-CoA kinase